MNKTSALSSGRPFKRVSPNKTCNRKRDAGEPCVLNLLYVHAKPASTKGFSSQKEKSGSTPAAHKRNALQVARQTTSALFQRVFRTKAAHSLPSKFTPPCLSNSTRLLHIHLGGTRNVHACIRKCARSRRENQAVIRPASSSLCAGCVHCASAPAVPSSTNE